MAAIRPAGKPEGTWALPKGKIGQDERPRHRAAGGGRGNRGQATSVGKLGDVRYVYTWAGERIFKVVSFYLVRYRPGRLGEVPPEHAHEVAERWLPLEEAPALLAYGGEREMAERRSRCWGVRLRA